MYVACEICGEVREVPEDLAQELKENDEEIIEYVCDKCKRTDEVGVA